jgi:hypothetical protein
MVGRILAWVGLVAAWIVLAPLMLVLWLFWRKQVRHALRHV